MSEELAGNYFDRQGNPISIMDWSAKFEDVDYKVITQTDLPDGKLVSTIWLGINHRFGPGAPLIFETMVFSSRDDFGELDMDRYTTEAEAITGHGVMVAKWTTQPETSDRDESPTD